MHISTRDCEGVSGLVSRAPSPVAICCTVTNGVLFMIRLILIGAAGYLLATRADFRERVLGTARDILRQSVSALDPKNDRVFPRPFSSIS